MRMSNENKDREPEDGKPEPKQKPPYPEGYEYLEELVAEANERIRAYDQAIENAKPPQYDPGYRPPGWLRPDRSVNIPTWERQREEIRKELIERIKGYTGEEGADAKGLAARDRALSDLAPSLYPEPEAPEPDMDQPDPQITAAQERILKIESPGEEGGMTAPEPPANSDIEPDPEPEQD